MPEHTRFRRSVARLRQARSEIINQLTRMSYEGWSGLEDPARLSWEGWSGSEYRQLEDELREIDRLLANKVLANRKPR